MQRFRWKFKTDYSRENLMKFRMMIVAMVLFLSAVAVFGADIDGRWTGKHDAGMGEPMDMEYTFKVDGNTLTGTSIDGRNGETVLIKNGKIDGNKISYSISFDPEENGITLNFTGELSGGKLKLNYEVEGMGFGGEFTVERDK